MAVHVAQNRQSGRPYEAIRRPYPAILRPSGPIRLHLAMFRPSGTLGSIWPCLGLLLPRRQTLTSFWPSASPADANVLSGHISTFRPDLTNVVTMPNLLPLDVPRRHTPTSVLRPPHGHIPAKKDEMRGSMLEKMAFRWHNLPRRQTLTSSTE